MFSREVSPWKLLDSPGVSADLAQAATAGGAASSNTSARAASTSLPRAEGPRRRAVDPRPSGRGTSLSDAGAAAGGLEHRPGILVAAAVGGDGVVGPAAERRPSSRPHARRHRRLRLRICPAAEPIERRACAPPVHRRCHGARRERPAGRPFRLSAQRRRHHRRRDLRIPERERRARTHRAGLRHHRRGVFLEETAARYATPRACRA